MGENEKPVMVLPKSVNINKLTGMVETCKIILNDRKKPLEIRHVCDDIYSMHEEGKIQNLGFVLLESKDEI